MTVEAKVRAKKPRSYVTHEMQTDFSKNFTTPTWQKHCSSRSCKGKMTNHHSLVALTYVMEHLRLAHVLFNNKIDASKINRKTPITYPLQTEKRKQRSSTKNSHSHIQKWGTLGACSNYFWFWEGNICSCRNDISKQFQQSILVSFQHCNTISRQIQKMGFRAPCTEDERLVLFTKYLMTTHFCLQLKFANNFTHLQHRNRSRIFPKYPSFGRFLKHFKPKWIFKYPPGMWKCRNWENSIRTSNSCEVDKRSGT